MSEPSPEQRRRVLRERLTIVQAMLEAHDQFEAVEVLIATSEHRNDALQRLQRPPFEWTEPAAHHVLDMPLYTRTVMHREQLAEEAESLRSELARLSDDP